MDSRAIDIVVPVYNGHDDLLRCVESLKKHTDLSKHRVIFIDDCSPDERVRAFLRKVCGDPVTAGSEQAERIDCGMIAVFNEQNRGFSANVNIGLAWSERDTILLNSDTVVTRNWVEKIQACAYRSERTATVTPLSNAATLASVPVFLKDNPLPEGYTPDTFADLVERVSLHRYPRVTVAVGFCMYVKQEAYELVGEFDAKTFGRGYGEENDFCCRCSMLGYTHVLCDDTFIYHAGTASFASEEKKKLIEEHDRILRKRYPDLMKANDEYCAQNPDQEIRDNLLLHMCLDNGRKNLLYLLHLDFREIARSSIGGTQLHVRDLVRGAKDDWNVYVASRDGNALRLTVYLREDEKLPEWRLLQTEETAYRGGRLISLKFPIGEEEPFPVFYDEKMAELLKQILQSFSIDLVHVHHTQGLTLDIYRVCSRLKIPVAATLHDYFYACPTTKLVREDQTFCPSAGTFEQISEKICARCLHSNCGYGRVHAIRRWRQMCHEALLACDRILFPSESAKDLMLQVYPDLEERSMVIEHGTDAVASGSTLEQESGDVIRTDRMHSRLDQQPSAEGGFHYIAGWAWLEGEDSRNTSITIEIRDSAGAMHYMQVGPNARADVAAAAASDLYLWSGFHAVFNIPDMPDGKYRIRLLIHAGDKVYTDGRVWTGTWMREGKSRGKKHRGSSKTEHLNVAFLGGVTKAKGSKLLSEVISSRDERFTFYVFGEVGDSSVQAQEGADNVYFSGVYRKDDIFDLLKISGIDVACILPIWAETFCYTLSEAWSCRIPVIGTDLGAVGERIRKSGAGWLLPEGASRADVMELLERIVRHPEELEQKKTAAAGLHLKSVDEMNEEYRALYAEMIHTSCASGQGSACSVPDPDFVFQALAMANPSVTGQGEIAAMNRVREENEMLRTSMEMLKNTTSYRIARKISEADIPFKEPLKKLLRKR